MKTKMVCLEDGITSCGFRKMASYVAQLEPDTESCYITTTSRWRSVRGALAGTIGNKPIIGDDEIDEMAQGLKDAELIGYSSMTGYADLTRRVIKRVRELSPDTYQIWGGIHPIIQPEDAILADVDAICTGEGEFAFEEFYNALKEGRDPTNTKNFWFKATRHLNANGTHANGEIIKNHFLPLMSVQEMEQLPFPQYGAEREVIYVPGDGFVPMGYADYIANDGLSYMTLWSIGCPFHCSYCGNTKFIANDAKYKRIRHPSAQYMVDQVKDARSRFPHLSHVSFNDDSFMAIPYGQLEEFAELWRSQLGIPFAVYGVIPNYVRQDKFELLSWAGMNRVRMGIQSGSQAMLDFYKRPTPPEKVRNAGKVIASFAPRYHIPGAYDIIMDNPIETRDDVKATLQLLYDMDRPYTLLIYSLKVIPNTGLEAAMKERGLDVDAIDDSYLIVPPRVANLLLYVLALWRPPPFVWRRMMKRVRASHEPQKLYPRLGLVLRAAYLTKRALSHVRVMDFSITPGKTGYFFWRVGLVGFWQKRLWRRPQRPKRTARKPPEVAGAVLQVIAPEGVETSS
ncbi:MAG: cobalamin-dependent protein [Actinomycetota bacterium]|nr:cobalamin-dependent protein [Actinomycetota bacterium]